MPHSSLKYIIGKGRGTSARIEDLTQYLILVHNCREQMAVVNFYGDCFGLGRFLVFAVSNGHFSMRSILKRNGISSIDLGPLLP